MSAIVFTSGGSRKYHFDKKCKGFESAQMLNDWDCCYGDYCSHRSPRMHPLKRISNIKAATDGKLPCLACVPRHLRELPPSEDFAHEPIVGISLFGLAETVCQRCTERGVWYGELTDLRPVHILWPCTSAVILGLVSRTA